MIKEAVVFAAALVVGCFSAGRAETAPMRAEITGKQNIRYETLPKTACYNDIKHQQKSGLLSKMRKDGGCTISSQSYRVSIDCNKKVLKIELFHNFTVQISQWVKEQNDKILFDSTLKHELTHVALMKKVYQKYAQSAAAAGLAYVEKNGCLNGALTAAYNVMAEANKEAERQNALIDGEENYSYQDEQVWAMQEKEQLARRQREEAAARKAEEKRQKPASSRQMAAAVPEHARLMLPERAVAAPSQTRQIARADTPVKIRQLQKIQPVDAPVKQREETGMPPPVAAAETPEVLQTSEMPEKRPGIIDALERFAEDDLKKSIKSKMPNASDELIDGHLETMDPMTKIRMEAANITYKVIEADKERYRRQKLARQTQKSPKQLSDEFREKHNLPDPADDPDAKRRTFRSDHWAYDWISMILDDLNDKIRYREKFDKIRDAVKGFFGKKDGGAKKSAATK